MTPIKYIGHRENYREGCYGSGLVFDRDQTINVDDDLARKLLKHKDVYVLGDADESNSTSTPKQKPADDEDDSQQNMRDSIAVMTKAALTEFAKTHFNADLNQRQSVGDMRIQVTGLVDQFGVD